MSGDSIEELERILALFEKQRQQDDGDYTKAVGRLQCLKLRRDLRQAMLRRNVGVLDQVISKATGSQYENQLKSQIEAAKKLRQDLSEVKECDLDILDMEPRTVLELRRYHHPPKCICDVIRATYLLLGENESGLKSWSAIQTLLGKHGDDGIIQRVSTFDSTRVDESLSKRVNDILDRHNPSEIRAASPGAATLYFWTRRMVEDSIKGRQVDDDLVNNRPIERVKLFSCFKPRSTSS
ncbi:uncharacterized protein LOC121378086 [Gigantopelta aegis]|uniref:uncharacterized protein LOC121378086 n=1 Tax=Gigantopelta aegis TaxID=1735272 RepID=UPI001B88B83C|nr:uncharacterized protein LOC121378086 [Gigantopelta aegis]